MQVGMVGASGLPFGLLLTFLRLRIAEKVRIFQFESVKILGCRKKVDGFVVSFPHLDQVAWKHPIGGPGLDISGKIGSKPFEMVGVLIEDLQHP